MDSYDNFFDERDNDKLEKSTSDVENYTDITDEIMSNFNDSLLQDALEQDKLEKAEEAVSIKLAQDTALSLEINNFRNSLMEDLKDGRLDMDRSQLAWILDRLGDQAMLNRMDIYLKSLADDKLDEKYEEKESVYSLQDSVLNTEEKMNDLSKYIESLHDKGLMSDELYTHLLEPERDKDNVYSPGNSQYDSFASKLTKKK